MEEILAKNLNVQYTFAEMYWSHVTPQAKDFIQRLLCKNPSVSLCRHSLIGVEQWRWRRRASGTLSGVVAGE
jgi:hypothetical protein